MHIPSTTRRPGSVTIVVILTWINAILQILFGVLLLVAAIAAGTAVAGANRVVGQGLLTGIGSVYLLIGAVTALVASRLGRGGHGSRMLLTGIELITIVSNLIAWITAQTTQATVQAVIAIIVAALILALLWNRRANDFFS